MYLFNNYRPRFVLPIVEKIMYNKLINVFNKNDFFLTKHQFGFREKHSTYMTILDLIDKISHQTDSKNYYLGNCWIFPKSSIL